MSKKKRPFVSLNLKMVAALLIGLLLAACTYLACGWVTSYVCEVRYTSEEALKRNVDAVYDALEEYIEREHVKATDNEALSSWMKDQEDTYLFIYDNYTNVFEAGWWENAYNEYDILDGENETMPGTYDTDLPRIDEDSFSENVRERIVEFADGKYYVYVDVYKELRLQEIMQMVSIVLAFLALLITLLIYHRGLIKRIAFLSSQVQQVSDGKLDYRISALHNDEIGLLAESVDNMRTSIIRKHQHEKEAWEANTQLITAMSHDVRTPLTSMIGYLDIIEGKKYENQEQLDRYVSSCREKAFQLKDLSDKLFQYFLVFGSKEIDKNLEEYDAGILFQQLLTEHCAEILGYGFRVNFQFTIPETVIRTDISSMKRLFDNIFSNIMKYADKKTTVDVTAEETEEKIHIRIANEVLQESRQVESTRIGLKTCEKICRDLQGSFTYEEQDDIFAVEIFFPAGGIAENEEENKEANEERDEEEIVKE
ncbi:MAG: histidine kinase dimerization/phospho-acceptor domain-containing protein [Emergencia sp.]